MSTTAAPVPIVALPVTVTGPGTTTALFAGAVMVTPMLVPPGRLPVAACAGMVSATVAARAAPAVMLGLMLLRSMVSSPTERKETARGSADTPGHRNASMVDLFRAVPVRASWIPRLGNNQLL